MLLPRGVLKLAMCAAREKARYAMDGLAIERDASGTVTVTATDGKRLVRAELSPETATARAIGETFGITDNGARIPLTVIPTRDEYATKGSETLVSLGLPSLVRSERKASSMARKADNASAKGPRKPQKPKMTALPKCPPLPALPSLPKRAHFTPNDGESIDACLARFKAESSETRERRATVKAERSRIRDDWRGVRRAVKSQNAARKAEHKDAIVAWKADRERARIEARKARDVVALEVKGETIGIAVAPKRVRELRAVEGHYPPVSDVIPNPERSHSHTLIVDARALALIVDAWRASLRADDRATCGESSDPNIGHDLEAVRIELEGQNVNVTASHAGGARFSLSESQRTHLENWMRVLDGKGKCTIGLNAFLLSEMAESLNSAIGHPERMSVRLGIKSESDAVLVAPCAVDESTGPAFAPSVGGVKVTGVIMPINLR